MNVKATLDSIKLSGLDLAEGDTLLIKVKSKNSTKELLVFKWTLVDNQLVRGK
jgi:hypothetical protein